MTCQRKNSKTFLSLKLLFSDLCAPCETLFLEYFQSFYGDRFGHDVVSMIKDSNTVEREKLDTEKVIFDVFFLANLTLTQRKYMLFRIIVLVTIIN